MASRQLIFLALLLLVLLPRNVDGISRRLPSCEEAPDDPACEDSEGGGYMDDPTEIPTDFPTISPTSSPTNSPTTSPTVTPCPAGSYFDRTMCKPCSTLGVGYYRSLIDPQDTCQLCESGFTNNAQMDGCDSCSVGKYGLRSVPGVCRSCPTNSTSVSQVADDDNEGCDCYSGYRNELGVDDVPDSYGVFNLICKPCPPGRYGADCAGMCNNGHSTSTSEISTSETSCEACAVGSYSEQELVEWISGYTMKCKQCEIYKAHTTTDGKGKHYWGEGAHPCGCEPGYSYNADGECIECSSNSYQSLIGQALCQPCPAASTSSTGASRCTCDAVGHHMSITIDELGEVALCEPCSPGSFYDSATESCVSCGAGTFTDASASTSCTSCDPDTWSNPGSSACEPCPEGSSTNGLSGQRFEGCLCSSGHGIDLTLKPPVCSQCTVGTYSSAAMQLCEACPLGHAVNLHGASACDECEAGKSQILTGQTHCADCGLEKFSEIAGSFVCDSCPDDSTWPGSALLTSSSMYDCACSDGKEITPPDLSSPSPSPGVGPSIDLGGGSTESPSSGYTCTACPAGKSKSGGNNTCVSCAEGKFADSQGLSTCSMCDENSYATGQGNLACTTCPEGSSANTYPATSVYQCVCGDGQEIKSLAGSATYQCGSCPAGKYSNSKSAQLEIGCATCPENEIAPNPGSHTCSPCTSPLVHNANYTKCVLARPEDVVPFANISLGDQATEHSVKMYFKDFTHVGLLWCKATDLGDYFSFAQYDGLPYLEQRGEYDPHSSSAITNRSHAHIKEYGQVTHIETTADTPTITFAGLASFSIFDISCFLEYLDSSSGTDVYKNSKVAYEGMVSTLPGYPLVLHDSCNRNTSNTAATLNFAASPVAGTAYFYALEASSTYNPYADYVNGSIAFPTASEMKANGVSKFVEPITPTLWGDGSFPDEVEQTGPLSYCVYPHRDGVVSETESEGGKDGSGYALLNYEAYYQVTISDLKPLTTYHILFWSEDDQEPRDFHPEVFEIYSGRGDDLEYKPLFPTIQTGCCGFISLAQGFGISLRATVTSSLLTFELSQHPTQSVQVMALAYYFIHDSNTPCSPEGFQAKLSEGEGVGYLDVTSTALSSRVFNFTSNKDTSLEASFTATFQEAGCGIVVFQYVGSSVDEYGASSKGRGDDDMPTIDAGGDFSFTKSDETIATFVIESAGAPPAAPALSSVIFSQNGDKLIVDFVEATDIGSTTFNLTTLYSEFDCNSVLTIQGTDEGATCQFISSTCLQVTLPSTSSTVPGSDIAVNANKIYAVCMVGVDCSSSTNAEPLVTTIGLPESPLTPVVTVSGPLSISRCGDIRLDASTSFGNGGRDWLSFSWSFSASASDTSGVTSVVDAANSADAFDPVLTIPNANLRQGQQYSFQLTLTNFLSQTSSLTNYFVVSVADNSVPTVTIEGDSYRYISRSEEISLFASGEAASCGDELKIIPAAQYLWSNSYGLEQTSADLRYFKVPAFTLTPGQVYTFTVLVTDSDALTNTASIQVEVEEGDLVAKITGGGRSVGATSSVTLSGASSFDTDYPERRGTADGFAYSWTCLESSPSYGAACTGLSDSSGESLSLDSTALNYLLGSTLDTITLLFTLQFTTTDSADTRYSELSTFITIERVDPPEVSITPIYVVKVNPSKKLQIKGSIETDSTNAVAAFWECEQIEYLDELSASPTSLVVPASSIATTVPFNLILPSGSLAGATYDFRLVAGFDGVSSSPQGQAQISIVVNSPPSAGSVSVSNSDGGNTGTALQTEFSIRAQNWVDDASDLPFTYSLFYRVTGATDETQITVDSASAIKDAVLLPVGGGNASSVVVTAKVADKYGSFGEASALAVVKAPQLTLEDMGTLTEQLTEDALAKGDTELVFQVLESSTSILNSVNCSLAPDCAGLNRLECEVGETSHACGKCLSGFVVENSGKGTSLPGNSQCKIKSASCENGVVDGDETDIDCGGSCGPCGVGKACSLDADCYFEVCGDADICVAPQKNCVDNCNQRGSCVAKDYNGKAMAAQSCTEDVICRVSCSCDDGYFGDGCEKDAGEQQEVVKQRRNMLKTLKNVTKLQDVSSEAINQQASSIKSLVERVDELDDDSKELAVSLVEDIAAGAKSAVEGGGSLEQSTANYIGETVSSLMQVSSDDETSDQAELISNAIDSLAEAQITSLFVGEEPLVVVTENLKVSSEKVTLSNMPGKSFATPTSEEDEAKGIKPPQLTMPQSGLDGYFDDDCNVGVSVAELGNLARSDNSSLDTTVMRLGLGCYKVAGSSRRRATSWWQGGEKGAQGRNLMTDSSVIVVLQNTDGGGGGASGEDGEDGVVLGVGGENFVDCEWDEYKSMTCPGNSSSFPVCSGIKGNTTITCPDSSAPSCGISTTDTSWNSSSCVVISSSSDNVTCSCDVLGRLSDGDAGSSTSRRLNTIYDDQQSSEVGSTENIDFAGLFTGIVGQFFNTWKGASALSWQMVEQNIVVFATISVLLVGAFLMCVRGKIRDKYDEIRDKNQKEIEFLSRGITEEDKYEYILSKSTPIFVQYMDNLWMNIKTQIGRRHDLSSTVFYYSPIKSRPQRVALLISTLLGMMFAESVLFDLAYPDYDPVCASLQTSEACLEPKSLLNTENNKCSWVRESQQCMFLEPEASLVSTMGIAIMACIVTSPLGVILVLIFNETIFPPTSGSMRAEARAMKFEREFKKKERGGAVADLTWDAFGDEEGSKFEMQDVDLSRDNSHKQVISDDEYLKRVQHQRVGGIGSDLEEDEEVKQMRADMEVTGCKKLVRDFCCCWTCCKKTTFDLRVEAEVSKALLAVKSRRKELEETVDRLKARAKQGDVSATVPLESAEVRLKVFREDWHLNEEKGGCGRRGYKTSLRYKVKHKVREDLRLADAIEKEFEDLETDVKEVRLLEYARMMKLSKIERKIYFQNRLIFENELPPVQRFKKFVGWIVIVSYCLGCGLYICLFGARVGATTCNTWLISFTLATLQDMFLYVPLKIMFMNVYLPGLISKRLKSIADPSDAENFQFTAFMPENASVYVAMNHPELDASNLVLSRGRAAQDDVEAHYDARHEAAMSPKSRRQGLKGFKMNTGIAVTKVKALRMYTSKGLSKFGLFFFAAFVLLPEFVQVSILDVVIPTAIGSFVYGNYQLYKLREWSPFTLDLVLILLIGGTVWWIRHRRHRHKLRKDHKEHVKKFRNSVVLELASVQLQSKPGQSIKKGNIKEERRRLSVQTEKEKKSLSDFSFPPTPKSPGDEEGGNVASPIHAKGRKKFAKGGQGLFAMVPLNSPGSRQVQL
ncbi:hypothetical protein TrVE_jg5792 [Triparma verrucosa]|uniref:Tyrosine-protein kinase ephrin type A/B receptor-like domain-containing protein n=1 Tax=Triparma verrucosa TaxID=1606542 RepID=A0A9W7BX48_9STRA|nr:hypothetical protein TrVE_jg5792 [Triparma verrucosa]